MQPELFLIEGKVSALLVGASTLNLLAPKQNMGNAAAGIAGAATDQCGNGRQLWGEDVVNTAKTNKYVRKEPDAQ